MEDRSRFLCDHMLGTLARWLRLLGYDTAYPGAREDAELLSTAEGEGRVLLTRDKDLAGRSGARGLYVASDDLDEQIRQVLTELRPRAKDPMSRCAVCNGVLHEATREAARGAVPEGVWRRQEQFWRCTACGQYYWRGTHWEHMRPRLDGYVALLEGEREGPPPPSERPAARGPSKA
ncbi:MAG: Mut7-C RNAse domain-containing protein [Thermoplasmata archaeon]